MEIENYEIIIVGKAVAGSFDTFATITNMVQWNPKFMKKIMFT